MTENEMTNQAAKTMPEPVTASMCPSSDYAKGWNDCLAALSQTAGVAEGWKLVPVEPTDAMMQAAMQREDDEPLSSWGKIVPAPHDAIYRAMLAAAPAASGGEVEALNLRGDETNQEVLVEFIRVCREVKPIGQWPGERVCRAIENLMNGPRDFISPDDRSPLRFGVGRGNEGGRLGLMGRGLATSQHDAASDAKCIWPDCGHDTNQVGYSSGCTGVYCHNRDDLPAKTDKQYADAEALIAHLDGLYDDDGQGCEKWGPAQAAIHGIRIWIADALSLPNPPSAASVSERARAIEILAGVCLVPPSSIAENTDSDVSVELAIRAIEQALTQQLGLEECDG